MEISKKISIGGINGVRKGFKGVKEVTFVGRIYGIARSAVQEEGANGAYWKFTGDFRAINGDGEEFISPVCFLPSPADGLLGEAVAGDKMGGGVQFAFDFYVEPREDVAIGYAYRVKPLIEQAKSDPLAALSQQITVALPVKSKQAALPGVDGDGAAPEEKAAPAKAKK